MPSVLELLLNSGPRQQTFNLTAALPPGWSFTRAGNTATYWNRGTLYTALANVPRFEFDANGVALGYLNEPAATNIYLNSQAPATQTIAVTAQAYTLSFYGTGTIALTGTYTGTLSGTGAGNLVQLPFTPTAGALVATVTGTVTNVQLEAGTFATSRIITGATAVTRNADNLTVPLKLYPWLQAVRSYSFDVVFTLPSNVQTGTVYPISFSGSSGSNDSAIFDITGGSLRLIRYVAGNATVTSYRDLLALAGNKNTLAVSVIPTKINFWINGNSDVLSSTSEALSMTTIGIGQGGWLPGTGVTAAHFLSLTLRAGSSTPAQLQAMR